MLTNIGDQAAEDAKRAKERDVTGLSTDGGDNDKTWPHLLNVTTSLCANPPPKSMKRVRESDDDIENPSKVRRVSRNDILSRLSDELLVRILSFIPVSSLLVCQRYV